MTEDLQAEIEDSPAAPRGDSPPLPRRDVPETRPDPARPAAAVPVAAAPRRGRGWIVWLVVILVVAAATGAGTSFWYSTRNQLTTDDAYTDGNAIMIAPKISGTVVDLAVNDNQFVHKGDLLIRIDDRDFRVARDQAAGQLAAIEGQLDSARIGVTKAQVTYPQDVAVAEGQLAEARGQLFQAQAEYKRQHGIAIAATTQQNVDSATAGLQQAQGRVQVAEAQLKQAQLVQQNLAQADAQVKQLEGQVAQMQAQLAQADLNLSYTKVLAPADGWVTRRMVDAGNYVQTGASILSLVSPAVWITANFKEDQLARLHPGQPVAVTVDAYPSLDLHGHIDSVQMGSGSKFTAFPPENATGNFVKIVQRVPVKILIDRGLDPQLPLPLGISVAPVVTVK